MLREEIELVNAIAAEIATKIAKELIQSAVNEAVEKAIAKLKVAPVVKSKFSGADKGGIE
jgi:hypothetical protein